MAKKILIMDDDPTIADLLTEALADEGYETYMTTQSLRFYDAVREHKPDLILLDLMMQYLDGAMNSSSWKWATIRFPSSSSPPTWMLEKKKKSFAKRV